MAKTNLRIHISKLDKRTKHLNPVSIVFVDGAVISVAFLSEHDVLEFLIDWTTV